MRLFSESKKKLFGKVIIGFVLTFLVIYYLLTVHLSDNKWPQVRSTFVKPLNNTLDKYLKQMRQEDVLKWFETGAQRDTKFLHEASYWGYLSEQQFNNVVDHVLLQMPIGDGDTIFELGCGVGAVLLRIRQVYGANISIGGSDLSAQAIKKVCNIFPNETDNFYVLSMTQKNDFLSENSQDHVISFGALAMYLYKEEMEEALQEAIRITKPGGHMCFTHFIEPGGQFIGSILEPVEKSYWSTIEKKYFLENLRIEQMLHQGDRYFVCFSKSVLKPALR